MPLINEQDMAEHLSFAVAQAQPFAEGIGHGRANDEDDLQDSTRLPGCPLSEALKPLPTACTTCFD